MDLHIHSQLRTRSQKVLNTLKKELEKFSPRNASKSPSLPKLRPNAYKKTDFPELHEKFDLNKPIQKSNGYINKPPKGKNIHLRDPEKFENKRRLSKQGIMLIAESGSSPRCEYKSPDSIESITKCSNKDSNDFVEKNSPILEAANNIILSCNAIFKPKEKNFMPKKLKRHIKQLNKLGGLVEDFIEDLKGEYFEGLMIADKEREVLDNKEIITKKE
ncbi:hypothetical protein SteCoe_26090 [Stentor coeruleus]|uniref:Uncharacterized protein n=1 Tax=Stentor coeruleus TaxID=5963 RepID=A0A1R2BDP9_9CILI|nr:hypothetical protein SteCoe_26090 [Stentor coeruleus]